MIINSVAPFDPEGPDAVFAQFIADGHFHIQHCQSCSNHIFYPRLICPQCGSQNIDWVKASGRGTVYSTSVPRGGPEGDYNISLIDLAEGPRMLSRVVEIAPDDVKIGMSVLGFVGEIDGVKVVLFKPEEKS